MRRIILLLTLISTLWGCTSSSINSYTYKAKYQDERITFILLHYTALNDDLSLKVLTERDVSSHYVVTTRDSDPTYQLVADSRRAWHVGESNWLDHAWLNDSSIGIEIVNLGFKSKQAKASGKLYPHQLRPADEYYDFTPKQIEKVGNLLKSLKEKHHINDKYILGHSDVTPQRKPDPGPKFPWKVLHDRYGVGMWYDEADKESFMDKKKFANESSLTLKQKFRKFGYAVNMEELPIPDNDSTEDYRFRNVIYAFQAHFRPEKTDGNMDLETYAILQALLKKYY